MAEDCVGAAVPGRAMHAAVGADPGVVADLHVDADVGKSPHPHAVAEPGARLDDCTWMAEGVAHASGLTSAHRISAQAACSPSNRALPSYRAMFRMVVLRVTSRSRRAPWPPRRHN